MSRVNCVKYFIFYMGVVLLCISLTGCLALTGGKKVQTSVLRPAEINLAGYEKVTVGHIGGDGGTSIRNALVQRLFDAKQYEVLDRESIKTSMSEMEIQTILGGGEGSLEAGKVSSANALISGISDQRCNQNVESQVFERTIVDGQGNQRVVQQTMYNRSAIATVNASLKMVDLETTQLIASANMKQEKRVSTGWKESTPASYEPRSLYEALYPLIVNEFMRKIAPYTDNVQVVLYSCKGVPEAKSGIAFMKNGDAQLALDVFKSGWESAKTNPKIKPKQISRIAYDYGVAAEYNNDFDQAKEAYTYAIQQDPGNKYYRMAMPRLQQRIHDRQRLQEQGVIAPE